MIKIAGYDFYGPYTSTDLILEDESGVYVILDGPTTNNTYSVLDVGQSEYNGPQYLGQELSN